MPIYEYLCTNCGVRVDAIQPIGTDFFRCRCGRIARKLISAPFVYRDQRFYRTETNKDHTTQEIRSKGQYDKFMKKNGLVQKTLLDKKHFKPKDFTKENRDQAEKLSKKCMDKIYKEGAMDWVQGKVNPNGADKAHLALK